MSQRHGRLVVWVPVCAGVFGDPHTRDLERFLEQLHRRFEGAFLHEHHGLCTEGAVGRWSFVRVQRVAAVAVRQS